MFPVSLKLLISGRFELFSVSMLSAVFGENLLER